MRGAVVFGDRIPIRRGDNEWNWEAEENGDDLTIKKTKDEQLLLQYYIDIETGTRVP